MEKDFGEFLFNSGNGNEQDTKKVVQEHVDKETGEVKQVAKEQPKTNAVVEKKESQMAVKESVEKRFLDQVIKYAETSGDTLSALTKDFVVNIVTMTSKKLATDGLAWNEIDIKGCGFISQIKKWAKLGVGQDDYLYLDIRNHKNSDLKDIAIKGQYQTIEKLMRLYYHKPIERFKTEIICEGDAVERDEDFETGLTKITGHKRNLEIDRNNLENIIGAYKIMYFRETDGSLHQLTVEIDKNRITRAMIASSSKEKTVWKQDSVKMVKKTVTWEMFNNENVRPFMNYPDDVTRFGDQNIVTESEEMNWNADNKYKNVDDANNDIRNNIAKGDAINVPFKE